MPGGVSARQRTPPCALCLCHHLVPGGVSASHGGGRCGLRRQTEALHPAAVWGVGVDSCAGWCQCDAIENGSLHPGRGQYNRKKDRTTRTRNARRTRTTRRGLPPPGAEGSALRAFRQRKAHQGSGVGVDSCAGWCQCDAIENGSLPPGRGQCIKSI